MSLPTLRVTTRNSRFQQWRALLTNRAKRNRAGEFLVHGVRPISIAVRHNWPIHALLYRNDRPLSRWAAELVDTADTVRVEMAPELLAELGDKGDEAPELVAVAEMPPDSFDRVHVGDDFLGLLFDRPSNPGNIGTLVRSADAFGASCVIVTGHAADVYDPKAIRASTGSMFAVPVIRAASHRTVLGWLDSLGDSRANVRIAGTDEKGRVAIVDYDLTAPNLLVIGNETAGMSTAWRQVADTTLGIPIGGAASSLNAAVAGAVVLYEAARQRKNPR